MTEPQTSGAELEVIFEGGNFPITAEIDRTTDPGNPTVRLECGCNEFFLDAAEASAVISYLQRVLPILERGGEDG